MAMKRTSEKTFGVSPELKGSKKRPKIAKTNKPSPSIASDNDTPAESDSLFIPSGNARRQNTSSTGKGGCKSQKANTAESADHPSISVDKSPPAKKVPVKPRQGSKTSKSTTVPGNHAGSILDTLGTFPGLVTPTASSNTDSDNWIGATTTESVETSIPAQKEPETSVPAQKEPKTSKPRKSQSQKARSGDGRDGTIIAGIDFGTTYSGICWAQTGAPEHLRLIQQWPDPISTSAQGVSSDKVPTELQYTEGQPQPKWGFQIPADVQRQKWFKLALDPNSNSSIDIGQAKYCSDPQAAPPGYNQGPEDIVTDYLTALRQHFEAVLPLPESVVSTTPIKYVISVPAMWSESAVGKTRRCAEKAGMGLAAGLTIVSEPEAAAIWALQQAPPNAIDIDDIFVLCDAGGGTVDLISYKVTALKPILRIVEVVPGQGRKCGSTFLNQRFEAFLKDKLSSHPSWQGDMLEDAMKRFELEVKRYFDGSKTTFYQIPVPTFPDSPAYDVRRARYTLKGTDLYDIFEPVVKDVIELVGQQIKATKDTNSIVKSVLLVGGFGENSYLHQRLRQSVADESIEVLKPLYGWTAVARGAVLKALADHSPKSVGINIAGRCAVNHYGTESAKEWKASIHHEDQRIWSKANSRYEVNTYDWFVSKGDTVSEKKPIRLHYHTECLASVKKLHPITITIVKCTDPNDDGAPAFVGDGEVTPVANLQVSLELIPTKNLKKRRTEDGKQWYIVDFSLKVTRTSAEFHYDLMRNHKSYGRVSAEFV